MDKKRLVYLDLCKVLAMFLVVWGHAIQHFIYGMEGFAHDAVWRSIQSFHMPLFMMIAGYFSSSSMKLSFWDIVMKKAKQLILPCVSWGYYRMFSCILRQVIICLFLQLSLRTFGS